MRRRGDLIRYAAIPLSLCWVLISPSKLKGVEGELRPLLEKPKLHQSVGHIQKDAGVPGLLEDLQEVIHDYKVRLRLSNHSRC